MYAHRTHGSPYRFYGGPDVEQGDPALRQGSPTEEDTEDPARLEGDRVALASIRFWDYSHSLFVPVPLFEG